MSGRVNLFVLLGAVFASCAVPGGGRSTRAPRWRLVVHGGAGLARAQLPVEREVRLRADLERALLAGREVLARGGASLDAVTATITVLEDSPYFNAGRGAVFNHEGKNELDAAIMDGFTRQAGSVAGVTRVKNPLLAARRGMERSGQVMLIGAGADAFAQEQGLELVEPSYYFTQERWDALQRARERDAAGVDGGHTSAVGLEERFGTVGAVALDTHGHLAAGTSTGGMTNKRFGRVGDSPIIGAGTWASASCAVSATGHGEHFIRHAVAHEICARVEHLGWPVARAASHLVNDELVRAGAEGGVIALDAQGGWAAPFNTQGMVRGQVAADGPLWTAVFSE